MHIKHKWVYSGTLDQMAERRCVKCGRYQVWLNLVNKWTTCVKWICATNSLATTLQSIHRLQGKIAEAAK